MYVCILYYYHLTVFISKSVALVHASSSYIQVFVFYVINNLCSVEQVN